MTGSKPVVFLALGTITITAATSLDVGSKAARPGTLDAQGNPVQPVLASPGPGASASSTCTMGIRPAASTDGGGYGGTFHGLGGDGQASATRGAGGSAAKQAVNTLPGLRAGCPGSDGAYGTNPDNNVGAGGSGGGAVALIATETIIIDGTINASGAGGGGGRSAGSGSGGGGGGSGGMIVLDVPSGKLKLGSSAQLFANGGGGGQDGGISNPGNRGEESTEPGTAAQGGQGGNANYGTGGVGSSGAMLDGQIGTHLPPPGAAGTGGGGGGGAGFVYAPGQTGTHISPPPSPSP